MTDQVFPALVVLTITPFPPSEYPIEGVGKQMSARVFVVPVDTVIQFTPPSDDSRMGPFETGIYPWSESVNVIEKKFWVVGIGAGYHCA